MIFYLIIQENFFILKFDVKIAPLNFQFEVGKRRFLICLLLSMRSKNTIHGDMK